MTSSPLDPFPPTPSFCTLACTSRRRLFSRRKRDRRGAGKQGGGVAKLHFLIPFAPVVRNYALAPRKTPRVATIRSVPPRARTVRTHSDASSNYEHLYARRLLYRASRLHPRPTLPSSPTPCHCRRHSSIQPSSTAAAPNYPASRPHRLLLLSPYAQIRGFHYVSRLHLRLLSTPPFTDRDTVVYEEFFLFSHVT